MKSFLWILGIVAAGGVGYVWLVNRQRKSVCDEGHGVWTLGIPFGSCYISTAQQCANMAKYGWTDKFATDLGYHCLPAATRPMGSKEPKCNADERAVHSGVSYNWGCRKKSEDIAEAARGGVV